MCALSGLASIVASIGGADPYPPYWAGGTGPAVHAAPLAWPAAGDWRPYTMVGAPITDVASNDRSNGGTSPQGYVNVSSGCADGTLPSIYYAYGGGVLFVRWRVQQAPNTYATGPSAGSFGSSNPWSSGLWTVLIDVNGDGYRDFAVQLDGSSGSPSAAIDRLAVVYGTSRSQSIDYAADPAVHLLGHNPTAFVDQATGRILNFQGTLTPTPAWPNGSAETQWDYGTTRTTRLPGACAEYFIDYQLPIALLDASGLGGPAVTANTPIALFFATSNSLNNPMQKDVVVIGDFIADPAGPVPFGDAVTLAGGAVPQPIVPSVAAVGCAPVALAASVVDALTTGGASTVSSVTFQAYQDTNGNGAADDGSPWADVAAGVATGNPVQEWRGTWNSAALPRGQYLIGVRATDAQGNVTWSHLTPAAVNATVGPTPPNYANPASTGVVIGSVSNTCGAAPPSLGVAASASEVPAGGAVTFTITVANPLATPVTVDAITAVLPPGFTFQSTGAGTIGVATTSPTLGAQDAIAWTFAPASTIPAESTRTLVFQATASLDAGVYGMAAAATSSAGTLEAAPVSVSVGAPSLGLEIIPSTASATQGQTLTYTLTYANESPVTTTGTLLVTTLPTGLTYVSSSGNGVWNEDARTVTWTLGTLPAASGGGSVTVTTTIDSPYPALAAVPLVTTAAIDSDQTALLQANASTYVDAPRPAFVVQVDGGVAQIAAGNQVTVTIDYANVGNGTAAATQIAIPVPAGFTVVSTGGGTLSGNTVTWSPGTVVEGGSGSVELVLQADSPYAGASPTTLTATITSAQTTPVADDYSLLVTITGSVCRTYYFHEQTTSVGTGPDGGTQRVATTSAPVPGDAGTGHTVNVPSGSVFVEAVRFYQNPATGSATPFSGNIQTSIYIDRVNGPAITIRGTVYDYDPAGGSKTSLGTADAVFNGSQKGLFQFNIAAVGTQAAGHRLLWVFEVKSNVGAQSAVLLFQYAGTVANTLSGTTPATFADSSGSFCTAPPAVPALDTQVSSNLVEPGDSLTYEIRFGNAGQTNMLSSTIVHELPAGVTYQSATLNGVTVNPTGVSGQHYTFDVNSTDTAIAGRISGGHSGTLVVSATVSEPFSGPGSMLASTTTLDSAETTPVADTAVAALHLPSVIVTATADRSVADPGTAVTYTITVSNNGTGTATNVTVTDVLPVTPYYTYVGGSATLNGVTVAPDPVAGGTLSLAGVTLASGDSAVITYQMTVASVGAPGGLTVLSTTATVVDAQTPGVRSSNAVDVTIRTTPVLTFTAQTTPSAGPVAPGSIVTYALQAGNVGSGDATSVLVVSAVPASTTFVPGSLVVGGAGATDDPDGDQAAVSFADGTVRFSLGALPAGASTTVEYSVRVDAVLPDGNTSVTADATLTAGNAPSRTASATVVASAAPLLTAIVAAPEVVLFPATTLAVTATATNVITVSSTTGLAVGQAVSLGGTILTVTAISGSQVTLDAPVTAASGSAVLPTIEYVIDYVNEGNAPATAVQLVHQVPGGTTFVSATGGGAYDAGTVTWTFGTVQPGEGGQIRVRVVPTAPGSYTSSASITSTETGPIAAPSVATDAGALLITKSTPTPAGTMAGGLTTATYVITAVNQHPSATASAVTVRDLLPAGFSYASTTSIVGGTAIGSPTPGDVEPAWSGLSIPGGGQVTITFDALVRNVAPGVHHNDVAATASGVPAVGFDGLATTAEDVTFAAPLGTSGTLTTTASIAPGGGVAIALADADLDGNPELPETAVVSLANSRTGEAESVTLTETGPATGVFAGSFPTVSGAGPGGTGNGTIDVLDGDTLQVTYTDALDATGGGRVATAGTAVASANAPPTLTVPATLVILEDAGAQAVSITGIGSGDVLEIQTLVVTASSSNTALVPHPVVVYTSPGATATLQFAPAADAFGAATITVSVSDGIATTAATIIVTVEPVNDPPTLDAPADYQVGLGLLAVPLSGIGFGPANESQSLLVTATSSNSAVVVLPEVVYTSPQTTGQLQLDVVANGSTTITVSVSDGSGQNGTVSRTFVVTAGAGAPPTIAPIADVRLRSGAVMPSIPVAIGDPDTPLDDLVVTASSSDPAVLSPGEIVVSGSGGRRELALAHPPDHGGSVTMTVTVSDGTQSASTTFVLTITVPRFYYLTEGSTIGGLTTEIVIANPNNDATTASILAITATGTSVVRDYALAPMGQLVVNGSDLVGSGVTGFSTRIESLDGLPLAVERTMRWDGERNGGHAEAAIEELQRSWHFAEGFEGYFATYVLLANFDTAPATATVRFLTDTGAVHVVETPVPARTRVTLPASWVPALAGRAFAIAIEASGPISAERSMYLSDRRRFDGGHVAVGQTPALRRLFAEGSTWMVADAFLLLGNAGPERAVATVTYRTVANETIVRDYAVPAHSRITIEIGQEDPRLAQSHFWIEVNADRPVMAERSMYWPRGADHWRDGHTAAGFTAAAERWVLADGQLGGSDHHSLFLMLANPGHSEASIRLSFRSGGRTVTRTLVLAAGSRTTFWADGEIPELDGSRFWILVESTNAVPVLVERSQYWDGGGQWWSTGTTLGATALR